MSNIQPVILFIQIRSKKYSRYFLMTLLVFSVFKTMQAQDFHNKRINDYTISFDASDRNTAKVKAKLILQDGIIKMTPWGHPWLPNGWATFVSELEIRSRNGEIIDYSIVEKEGWGSWEVHTEDREELHLSYKVNFNHHKYDWNPAGGIDSRPEVTDQALFLVNKALFIYSLGTESSVVHFEIPENWKIATNWELLDTNRYYVDSWINLVNNALVLGNFYLETVSNGPMDLIIAMDLKIKDYYKIVINLLQKQLDEYSRVFKGTPDRNYLISVRTASEDDGESFHDSFNQVITVDRIEERLIVWGNTMAHEMFHYWNGANFLVGENLEDLYWFSEGFTEYYSSRSLVRTKIIDKETYFRKLEHYLSRYFITKKLWPEEPISMVEAGKEKSKNWLLLYGGGATMALYFDIEIRRLTKGKKSLDDVMFLLKDLYGEEGKKINNNDVLDAINTVSQKDFTDEFKRLIEGADSFLDLESTLLKAGLVLDSFSDEMFLSEIERSENTIFQQIIGQ